MELQGDASRAPFWLSYLIRDYKDLSVYNLLIYKKIM
jgi:hypothetical protein